MSLVEKIKKQLGLTREKPKTKRTGKTSQVKQIRKVKAKTESRKEEWFELKGELPIDVIQTEKEIIIQAPLAGVKKENLEILIEKETVKIRGAREKPEKGKGDYLYQECYWGPFSREIILPVEVNPSRVEASLKEGLLTLTIPRMKARSRVEVMVEEEVEEETGS